MKVLIEAFATGDFWRLTGAVKLRIYANQSFWTSDGQYIPRGTQGIVSTAYLEVACTVLGNVLTIPGIELDSTVDGLDNPFTTYTAELVTGGRRIPFLSNFAVNTLADGDPSTTWPEILILRNLLVPQTISDSLTRQINALITLAVGSLNKASETNTGVTALTANPVDPAFPIAVGANDAVWLALSAGAFLEVGAAAGGDLGGTYPDPIVDQARGLRETSGPTTLTLGAIADGQLLKRSGLTIIGGEATTAIFYNVKDHGAVGDGATDDTAAIQSALTAAQVGGGVVFFPAGDYLVEGAGTSVFTITSSIKLMGVPGWSRIVMKGTASTTRDIITYKPTSAGAYKYPTERGNRYFIVEGLSIISQNAASGPGNFTPPANTGGRYAIVLDASVAFTYIHNFSISQCYCGLLNGDASILLNAGPTVNSNDIFTGQIGPNNILERGIAADTLGDTINIFHNNIRGTEHAINISSFMPGASTLNLIGNNIISDKGVRIVASVDGGHKVTIANNIIELFQQEAATPGSNGAMVDLDGLKAVTVRDNTLNSVTGAALNGIRLNNVFVASIRDNRADLPAGKFLIKPVSAGQVIQRQHNLIISGGTEIDISVDTSGQAVAVVFDAVPGGVQAGTLAVENARLSTLNLGGVVIAGNTTIGTGGDLTGDQATLYVVNATAGPLTITLAEVGANSLLGRTLIFKRADATGNTVTIARSGTDTIDGAVSITPIPNQWDYIWLTANSVGDGWLITGGN